MIALLVCRLVASLRSTCRIGVHSVNLERHLVS